MTKEEIKAIPLFPDYEINEIETDVYSIRSTVHIHKDLPQHVRIYLYPVEGFYVAKTNIEKLKATKVHLKECFRISKYMNTDNFESSVIPIVAVLDKTKHDFLDELHYNYP